MPFLFALVLGWQSFGSRILFGTARAEALLLRIFSAICSITSVFSSIALSSQRFFHVIQHVIRCHTFIVLRMCAEADSALSWQGEHAEAKHSLFKQVPFSVNTLSELGTLRILRPLVRLLTCLL
jgi:hypothetical protein